MSENQLGAMTVTGWVASSDLGVIQPHEHLICRPPAPYDDDAELVLDDIDAMVAEVGEFIAAGGTTLVEASPPGYGRDLPALVEIANRSGAKIIACTGRHKDIYCAPNVKRLSVDLLVEEFLIDVNVGRNGVRSGAIKVATSADGPTESELKVLTAAAIVNSATGVPITSHLEAGLAGVEQAQTLIRYGADPSKIVVGHIDRYLELSHIEAILDLGVRIQFDQIGHFKYDTDEARADLLSSLLSKGYSDRICLASDLGRRSYFHQLGGSPGLAAVQSTFLNLMRERGATSQQIDDMTIHTPAKVFSFLNTNHKGEVLQ